MEYDRVCNVISFLLSTKISCLETDNNSGIIQTLDLCSEYDIAHECDRQTDGQTDKMAILCTAIAPCTQCAAAQLTTAVKAYVL